VVAVSLVQCFLVTVCPLVEEQGQQLRVGPHMRLISLLFASGYRFWRVPAIPRRLLREKGLQKFLPAVREFSPDYDMTS
jgi:hypothetical protein